MSILKNNEIEIKGNNENAIKTILDNKDGEAFSIKRKISYRIMYLLIQNTNVKKIIVSNAIIKQLPKKLIDAAKKVGIKIVIAKTSRGRKKSYDVNYMKKILKGKESLKKISEKKKIPLRTLYHYKKQIMRTEAKSE